MAEMIADLISKAKAFLFRRKQAYLTVFSGVQGEYVLEDLAAFCRAHETTAGPDDRATYILEGRREVWLRIQHHLNLDSETLWKLYGKKGNT